MDCNSCLNSSLCDKWETEVSEQLDVYDPQKPKGQRKIWLEDGKGCSHYVDDGQY